MNYKRTFLKLGPHKSTTQKIFVDQPISQKYIAHKAFPYKTLI